MENTLIAQGAQFQEIVGLTSALNEKLIAASLRYMRDQHHIKNESMTGALYFPNKVLRIMVDESIRKNIISRAARNHFCQFDEGFRKHMLAMKGFYPSSKQLGDVVSFVPTFLKRVY
ncbi:hypothetical protein M5689_012883 [Euphorbia peplus]|nr:hypothetical protein M5689_012883 [Euphorbia peplus]